MPRTWDYLVVGAGMAGALLAAGLASRGTSSVLVLDSGTTRRGPVPAVRPHVLEFDEWVLAGSTGWAPEDVLPHFRRLETDHDVGHRPGHGATGPVAVRRSPEDRWSPADRAFRLAALHRGHPWAADHNAAGALGVSPLAMAADEAGPVAVDHLVRDLLAGMDGVSIRSVSAVERIVWDGSRAVGVEVTDGDGRDRVEAGEVLLCAGGTESPLLLQRSGIGPASLLRRAGVEPLLESPVGQGIQTHALVDVVGNGKLPGPQPAEDSFGMLARWNTGLVGATSGDLMAWTTPVPTGHGAALQVTGTVAQVLSRGSLGITAPMAGAPPILRPGLLTDPLDGYRMRLVVQHLFDLVSGLGLVPQVLSVKPDGPPLGLPDPSTALDDWARHAVRSAGYYASGCRMGDRDDPLAVVDVAGRVRGAEGLRVADESIMPALVKADPWLTSAAIGSRVAGAVVECTRAGGV